MSLTSWFLYGHFPFIFADWGKPHSFSHMSERGSVLPFIIQVAVVQCEFISSEVCTEGTQHLKWEFIIFKNSSIQVSTRNTSLLHSLRYLPFSQLRTFCLIVRMADSFLWLSFSLLVFPAQLIVKTLLVASQQHDRAFALQRFVPFYYSVH